MEVSVYEGSELVGSLEVKKVGLFWEFQCRLTKSAEPIRRIYVIKQWSSEYLGIPDADGLLTAKIPCSHLPEGVDSAVATAAPRGVWMPWRGVLDEIPVQEAFLRRDENGDILLALSPQETLKFPAWAEQMTSEAVPDGERAVLRLTPDGELPMIEKELGGQKDEAPEEMDLPAFDADVSAEPADAAGYGGAGEETGWEADRPDL